MGAWIEIYGIMNELVGVCVAPHDGCVDWNCELIRQFTIREWSHPTMGAWIEIITIKTSAISSLSHPTMGAWIEIIVKVMSALLHTTSHPTMGAWIEIENTSGMTSLQCRVAPHDGCVD